MSSRSTQCDLVLNALKGGPKTIWQLTEGLRISRPGARIFELKKNYVITDEWKEIQGRRVKVYTLEGHSQTLTAPQNAPDSEQQRTTTPLACAECHQGIVRKPRAKPLKQGEFPFCSDAHRARYHRRKEANVEVRPMV